MRPLRTAWMGTVDYAAAWDVQKHLAEQRAAGSIDDVLLMLEHSPVYTMGRQGDLAHAGAGPAYLRQIGAEYVDVDRGGSITFHGPGQLVAYPIVKLNELFPIASKPEYGDVDVYLRALESALIATVSQWGIEATRRSGHTGIWMTPSHDKPWCKLAAIGVKLARGVTTHGIALNVTTDLQWFSHVTPCGITDAGVCSIESLTGVAPAVAEVADRFAAELAEHFSTTVAPFDDAINRVVNASGIAISKVPAQRLVPSHA